VFARIVRAAAFLAATLLALPLFATLSVQGTIRFENRAYSQNGWGSTSYSPSRYTTVQILRASDNAVLYTTSTTASGTYNASVSGLNTGDSYKLKAWAQTAAVQVGTSVSATWTCLSVSTTNTNVTFDLSLAGACGSVARALNMVDAIVEGYQWAQARAGGLPDQVDVLFPSATHPQYDQTNNYIQMPDNDSASNDDVVIHEYGHFLADDFTATMTLPGGSHSSCATASSTSLAFSEAWASFIFQAVRAKEWGVAYYPSTNLTEYQDYETGTTYVNGSSYCTPTGAANELAVGAVLSDTRDSADESFDTISGQQQKTWDIVDKNWQYQSSMPDVNQFRTEWANASEIDPLFCKYIDANASYCPPATPTATAASNPLTTSFQANWSSAPRATGYRLDVSTSSSFSSLVSGYNNLDVGNVLSKSVTGLSPGTTYYYRVRAYNSGGTSGNSNTISATTTPLTCASFAISPASAAPNASSGSVPVTITGSPSGCQGGAWTASGNGSWLSVSKTSGSGSDSLTVSWTNNATTFSRSGNATIAANTFSVTQAGTSTPACTSFTITPSSANATSAAGSQLVTITGAPAGCQGGNWTASGNGSWLSVSKTSGSGSDSLTVSWTGNTSVSQRSANATIAGNLFPVTQAGTGDTTAGFYLLTPCRLVDSRNPNGPYGGPVLAPGGVRNLVVAGQCSVPSGIKAVAVNLVAVEPTADGWFILYPGPIGSARPLSSNINYRTGKTVANNAIVPVAADGSINIYNSTGAATHFIIDLSGYFQ